MSGAGLEGRGTAAVGCGVFSGNLTHGRANGQGGVQQHNRHPRDSHLRFAGAYRTGLRHGHGEAQSIWGDVYAGEYSNNIRHGKGFNYHKDGGYFIGVYTDGFHHGQGSSTKSDGSTYDGEFARGRPHGKGTLTHADGARQGLRGWKHQGEFDSGLRHKYGETSWPDGDLYQGHYVNDKREGKGLYTWSDGRTYRGDFKNGMRHGRGVFIWPSGEKYIGEYQSDRRHGQGTYMYVDGTADSGIWRGKWLVRMSGADKLVAQQPGTPDSDTVPDAFAADATLATTPHPTDAGAGADVPAPASQTFLGWFNQAVASYGIHVSAEQRETLVEKLNQHLDFEFFGTPIPASPPPSPPAAGASGDGDGDGDDSAAADADTNAGVDPAPAAEPTAADSTPGTMEQEDGSFAVDDGGGELPEPAAADEGADIAIMSSDKAVAAATILELLDRFKLFEVVKTGAHQFSAEAVLAAYTISGDGAALTYTELVDALYLSVYSVWPARPGPLTTASRKLVEACQHGIFQHVDQLLDDDVAFPDVQDEEGRTALFHAAVHGHLAIVQKLMDNGCNVDALTDQNVTPTSAAYHNAQVEFGRLDPHHMTDGQLLTHLRTCNTASGDVLMAVVHELLARGADPNSPGGLNSALACAVRSEDVAMVKALLAQGANPNDGVGCGGDSVLLVALHTLRDSTEKLGAAVAFPFTGDRSLTHARPSSPSAPVARIEIVDSECPALGIVSALLKAGADVNVPDSTGQYPIHLTGTIANEFGLRVLPEIIALSSTPDIFWNEETALSLAITNGNVAGAQLLLQGGANPNLALKDNRTAMQKLLFKANEKLFYPGARLEMVKVFLDNGANPLQKMNIAQVGAGEATPPITALLMDQLHREFTAKCGDRCGPSPPSRAAPSIGQPLPPGDPKYIEDEGPIMEHLILGMRKWNHAHIMEHAKIMERFCEECGRSYKVRLNPCNRCGMVLFCRDKCKMRAFSSHHRGVCAVYRSKNNFLWHQQDDESSTRWRPRGLPVGRTFEMRTWEDSAAMPFKVDTRNGLNPALDMKSIIRSSPISPTRTHIQSPSTPNKPTRSPGRKKLPQLTLSAVRVAK